MKNIFHIIQNIQRLIKRTYMYIIVLYRTVSLTIGELEKEEWKFLKYSIILVFKVKWILK